MVTGVIERSKVAGEDLKAAGSLGFSDLDGRLGLKNLAHCISFAYLYVNESICGLPSSLNEIPKAGWSRHG
jgi:hypothetical protein